MRNANASNIAGHERAGVHARTRTLRGLLNHGQ
jgi:hypothetical protein